MVVSSVKSSLLSLTKFVHSPREILIFLNNILYEEVKEQKFVSILLCMFESGKGVLKYSSAGHERILIYRTDQTGIPEVEIVKSGGVVLGVIPVVESFLEENTLFLRKGDKVLLYTDGVTEARNSQGEFFGISRLKESFQKYATLPIKEVVHNVHQEIKSFISMQKPYDDITLVGIEKT
ncbi:MAG: hypothetical protein DRQ24_10125 [Candidatus Latescibacterota bacterium]|nr:MAG: hypothetical protein DRQ24_10125 [Candidatus Latescibacterota bacterium]